MLFVTPHLLNYVHNLQGDIIAIVDSTGTKVVEYKYDAWGRCTIVKDINGISEINPIRYRSYYYDTETDLYYLNCRYYDPETGRFINADVYVSTGQGIFGNNMFAYCNNNSVICIDPRGKRTYIINGINNDSLYDVPDYIKDFANGLEELGIENVMSIAVYNGQSGICGTLKGISQVVAEMLNIDIYTDDVVNYITEDISNNPIKAGETINLIGYSGGGQIALNVMERTNRKIDNVVLIGTPVSEIWKTSTKISMIYGGWDPLSWNIGWGYKSYFMGWIGHTDYFKKKNKKKLLKIVSSIIG